MHIAQIESKVESSQITSLCTQTLQIKLSQILLLIGKQKLCSISLPELQH